MDTTADPYDVVIVGYGPTGMTLASLLGQRGHRVAVVERWPDLYGKPRLTHIDGETARLVSLAADGDHALREACTTPHYNWMNGKGRLLMDIAAGNTRRMLWDDHMSVHQPHIEEAIDGRVRTLGNVRLLRGWEATALEQDADGVSLTCQPRTKASEGTVDASAASTLRARWLVGSDGSNSLVRRLLGVQREDFGFNERWLLVDTVPLRPLPAKYADNAVQICDPRRGYMFMPIGKKRQRFEFALRSNEDSQDMSKPEAAWELLRQYHGLGPEDLSFIRTYVYSFECRLAREWRIGRVFLAGDAAHTNPPYLGQGACSGMRDASNLAWKFDLVLRGLADDALLDSYERERKPHAKQLMLDARSLGRVANTSNPVKAAIRDLLFTLKLTPKPRFPILTDGVLARDAGGKPMGESGTLPAQGRLGVAGTTKRFDEHVGFAFALVATGDSIASLPAHLLDAIGALGVKLVPLAADHASGGASQVVDVDGVYGRALDALGADAMLIRPDFVLYGHARRADLARLLDGFLNDLRPMVALAAPASATAPAAATPDRIQASGERRSTVPKSHRVAGSSR